MRSKVTCGGTVCRVSAFYHFTMSTAETAAANWHLIVGCEACSRFYLVTLPAMSAL